MRVGRNIAMSVMACLVACLLSVGLPQAVFAAPAAQPQPGSVRITMEAAEKIALDHAGATAGAVTFTEMGFDRKFDRSKYKIAFTWNNFRYKYDIDANSGAIIGYSRKEPKQFGWAGGNGGNMAMAPSDAIGVDAAKAAALRHASVAANQAYFTKVKLGRNKKRGTIEYGIDFFANEKKYKCKIDASSGEILEYSVKLVVTKW